MTKPKTLSELIAAAVEDAFDHSFALQMNATAPDGEIIDWGKHDAVPLVAVKRLLTEHLTLAAQSAIASVMPDSFYDKNAHNSAKSKAAAFLGSAPAGEGEQGEGK
jgi:hypothetical protein